jgi:hypothetical protein
MSLSQESQCSQAAACNTTASPARFGGNSVRDSPRFWRMPALLHLGQVRPKQSDGTRCELSSVFGLYLVPFLQILLRNAVAVFFIADVHVAVAVGFGIQWFPRDVVGNVERF